jgi:hypothetical protein
MYLAIKNAMLAIKAIANTGSKKLMFWGKNALNLIVSEIIIFSCNKYNG